MLPSPEQPTPSGPAMGPSSSSASDDLSLLAHMTSCGSELTQPQGHAPGGLPEDGPFKIQSHLADISSFTQTENQSQVQGASRPEFPEGDGTSGPGEAAGIKTGGDSASTTSDTERSDDGRDKDTKKIQTTATTQVGRPPSRGISAPVARPPPDKCLPLHRLSTGALRPSWSGTCGWTWGSGACP